MSAGVGVVEGNGEGVDWGSVCEQVLGNGLCCRTASIQARVSLKLWAIRL